jgi:hypothetical protein
MQSLPSPHGAGTFARELLSVFGQVKRITRRIRVPRWPVFDGPTGPIRGGLEYFESQKTDWMLVVCVRSDDIDALASTFAANPRAGASSPASPIQLVADVLRDVKERKDKEAMKVYDRLIADEHVCAMLGASTSAHPLFTKRSLIGSPFVANAGDPLYSPTVVYLNTPATDDAGNYAKHDYDDDDDLDLSV